MWHELSSCPPGRSQSGSRSTWAAAAPLRALMTPPSPTVCSQLLAANLSTPLALLPQGPRGHRHQDRLISTAAVLCAWATNLVDLGHRGPVSTGKGVTSVPNLLWPCSSECGCGLPCGGPAGEPAGLAGGLGTVPRAPSHEQLDGTRHSRRFTVLFTSLGSRQARLAALSLIFLQVSVKPSILSCACLQPVPLQRAPGGKLQV